MFKRGWAQWWNGYIALGLLLGTVSGCSIAGQWRTSQQALPQHWTLAEMTLSKDGGYTATANASTGRETETGSYRWNGFSLELIPSDAQPQIYSGRVTADGALLLSDPNQKSVTVRYERVDD